MPEILTFYRSTRLAEVSHFGVQFLGGELWRKTPGEGFGERDKGEQAQL
jgi:hypothetical protein